MIRAVARRFLNSFVAWKNPETSGKIDHNTQIPQWVYVPDGPCGGTKLFLSSAFLDMAKGSYDAFIYDFLGQLQLDLAGSVVWDVGAHFGYHSLAMAKLVGPKGNVLAFEPNPYNVQRLRLNLKANPELAARITHFGVAISDEDGLHSMRISSDVDGGASSGAYLDFGKPPSDRYKRSIYEAFEAVSVPVVKADTFVTNEERLVPQLIKLDVEGAEPNFLQGAHCLLASHRPSLVIEVHNIQSMFEVHEMLYANSYRLFLLDDGVNSSSRCFVFALPLENAGQLLE